MNTLSKLFQPVIPTFLFITCFNSMAQQPSIQYYRPNDKNGINVFETTKDDTVQYSGIRVRIGGNFTQDFQMLTAESSPTPLVDSGSGNNKVQELTSGFNLAMANLNIDAQLSDGIRLNLVTYLSSRHHQESWVKGGYMQFDKLPFNSDFIKKIMDKLTIKIGDFEVDYGDQHYRRTDGGNTIFNPFVENYIMDAFCTEIGGEIYYHSKNNWFVMGGVSNGQLNPTIVAATTNDASTGEKNYYAPAYHGKLGYDKQLNSNLRMRITGSAYINKSSPGNTLFFGDRTGSHYFFVMENTNASVTGNAWSGRYNPSFRQEVSTFMINPFIKFRGLEFFGAYEMAKGRTLSETELREATQYALDLIYRFSGNENCWIGVRYNSLKAEMSSYSTEVTINRMVGSIGWFLTKNIMIKAEYVNQEYEDFPAADIRSGGKFSGAMIEASVGF